jgi:hypothetical protein
MTASFLYENQKKERRTGREVGGGEGTVSGANEMWVVGVF